MILTQILFDNIQTQMHIILVSATLNLQIESDLLHFLKAFNKQTNCGTVNAKQH